MKPRILAIISARGGSKGLPRKNIKLLAGKPMIAWTIEAARNSQYITQLIVSTEDAEIIEVAEQYGCDVPFIRPQELAQDTSSSIDVVVHALEQCAGYDYVVLLQPTSPLRATEDIDGCIQRLLACEGAFCVSVSEVSESPYWMYHVGDNGAMSPIIKQDRLVARRQELPLVYSLNGAVYVAKVSELLMKKTFLTEDTLAYVMPEERSMDIDTEDDFLLCERVMGQRVLGGEGG